MAVLPERKSPQPVSSPGLHPSSLSLSRICWALTLGLRRVVTWVLVGEKQGGPLTSYSSKSIGATRTQGSLRNPARQHSFDKHHMRADSAVPAQPGLSWVGRGLGRAFFQEHGDPASSSTHQLCDFGQITEPLWIRVLYPQTKAA